MISSSEGTSESNDSSSSTSWSICVFFFFFSRDFLLRSELVSEIWLRSEMMLAFES